MLMSVPSSATQSAAGSDSKAFFFFFFPWNQREQGDPEIEEDIFNKYNTVG